MHIAIAAAANHAVLPIYKRPVLALIANGDELKAPGSEVSDTDIISSTPAGLGALIRHWGGEVMDMGIASDSIEASTKPKTQISSFPWAELPGVIMIICETLLKAATSVPFSRKSPCVPESRHGLE